MIQKTTADATTVRLRAGATAVALGLLGAILVAAPASPAGATGSDDATARAGAICDRSTFNPRVRRVYDMKKEIEVHRRSNHTMPAGTHTSTTTRKARIKTRLMAGASSTIDGKIGVSGLAAKALIEAEGTFQLELVAKGSRTWTTSERVRIGYRVHLRHDTTYVFFRGVEKVSGKYKYRGCLDDGDGDRAGVIGVGTGRWVSWEDTESGAVSCGNPDRTLSNIARAARDRGCN